MSPDVVAVERVFFQVNVKTAMSVGQASGLALVAAAEAGCEVAQYTSNEVKQALVGYGAATKDQVQQMVARVLHLATPPRPPDVADALALAVCHLTTVPLQRAVGVAIAVGTAARERSLS
jgi:crossover junction endodeoxyribonuclease RuvC